MKMYADFIKRLLDFLCAALAILFLIPVMLAGALALAMTLRGNPFFTQERAGYRGRPFRLHKLRTMTNERDRVGKLLPDAQRLTRTGRFIRGCSLDELPQLINVLRGDMSLIGPRPLHMRYLPRYSQRQARRHEVRPGISGWAQVNGRNTLSWKERFELDVYYVDHQSFSLDLKILWLTIIKVLKRSDINSGTSATMTEFMGSTASNESAT
jgi:undecaprenyl phosphate N,N'-diacetylbacillosamine 1-phosphate transferase